MKKIHATICAALLALTPPALLAQTPSAADDAKKAAPAKAPAKKKAEPKKADPKKEAPKKVAAKPADKKAAVPPLPQNITVLKNSKTTPLTLRDKDGNIIPTNPDAYDVSSATGKKK
jgi:glucose/arabinose dehydrogenase